MHIQASYNPILDMNGNVFKVVKFATDVTARVDNVDLLAAALQSVAEGDLTQQLSTPFLPALEKLRTDFNVVRRQNSAQQWKRCRRTQRHSGRVPGNPICL